MTVRMFRKKPIVITAVQWTGDNLVELVDFTNGMFVYRGPVSKKSGAAEVYDVLHDTWVLVYPGQWVIRGVQGEFYPIAEDVLEQTYDKLTGEEE